MRPHFFLAQAWTNITKSSILDVADILDMPLIFLCWSTLYSFYTYFLSYIPYLESISWLIRNNKLIDVYQDILWGETMRIFKRYFFIAVVIHRWIEWWLWRQSYLFQVVKTIDLQMWSWSMSSPYAGIFMPYLVKNDFWRPTSFSSRHLVVNHK